MDQTRRKKELLAAYKERPVEGGICLVRNAVTGRCWLYATRDVGAQRNRFQFFAFNDTPPHMSMKDDFAAHGADSFTLTIPETLEKKPEQTDREFQDDLNTLEALWRERLTSQGTEFYVT